MKRCESGLKCLSAFGFWGTRTLFGTLTRLFPESQMPFGFWVLGNGSHLRCLRARRRGSQMPFGFWVLGNACENEACSCYFIPVSNAFRLLGSGERIFVLMQARDASLLSQMPFGFWVLGNRHLIRHTPSILWGGLKCLSAFGFWGTSKRARRTPCKVSQMPFGFWVLGNNQTQHNKQRQLWRSQMPFGFWVLGNFPVSRPKLGEITGVSNAFRLLGSGEPSPFDIRQEGKKFVSNAFRLLGSGER